MESKNVENNKGIENGEMILENVDELRDDFHTLGSDGFNHCSGEKYIVFTSAVNSMQPSG